jgi:hypothetical protein
MAMTYTVLTGSKETEGSIKNMINFADLPASTILTNAQSLIYSFMRVREMKQKITDTFTTGDTDDSLPVRFQEPIAVHLIGNNKQELKIYPPDDFERMLGYETDTTDLLEGAPSFCTINTSHILINVTCDDDYDYSMWYFSYPEALSATNETNFLTDRYPHILTAAIRHFAFDHRQADAKAATELKKCMGYIEKANIEADYVKGSYTFNQHWDH